MRFNPSASEEGIVRPGEPLGQELQVRPGHLREAWSAGAWSQGVKLVHLESAAPRKRGDAALLRAGIFTSPLRGDINDLLSFELMRVVDVLAAVLQNFVLHLREESRPVVIVILAPAIERMIVALGAL